MNRAESRSDASAHRGNEQGERAGRGLGSWGCGTIWRETVPHVGLVVPQSEPHPRWDGTRPHPRRNPLSSLLSSAIEAAGNLQRNRSQFFPFGRELKIGSNELLEHHGAEGVELRSGAKCPVRGTVHIISLTSETARRAGVLSSMIRWEDLPRAVTLSVTVDHTDRVQAVSKGRGM